MMRILTGGLIAFSIMASVDVARGGPPLTIPAGQTVELDGEFPDHVIVHGTLNNTPGAGVMLMDGIEVHPGGIVELESIENSNNIYVNDTSSGVFGGYLDTRYLSIGDWGTGHFVHDGGTVRSPDIFLGAREYRASGDATYELRSGTLDCPSTLRMGSGYSTAHYLQTGGVANINVVNSYIANTIEIRGGELNSYGMVMEDAIYDQSDGTVVITRTSDPNVWNKDGAFRTSYGTANISGGSLTALYFPIKSTVNHSGGTVVATPGGGVSVMGTRDYNLFGTGELTTPSLGISESATFRQSGGELNTLSLSLSESGQGTYGMLGGLASVQGDMVVGKGWDHNAELHRVGIVDQSGGALSAGHLQITESSTYTFSGGSLSVGDSIDCSGVFDFAGGTGSITGGGIVNLANAIGNASGTSLDVGAESLVILPAGLDPSTDLAAFTSLGIVAESGQVADIPAGQTVTGRGRIGEHVSVGGTLRATADTKIDIEGGLSISPGGSAELGQGVVQVLDDLGEISGGQLDTGELQIGRDPSGGRLRQTGGAVTTPRLYVAKGESARGTYVLDGGNLTTEGSFLGSRGYGGVEAHGRFEQNGGVHTADTLIVGVANGNKGTYELKNGELNTKECNVGKDGNGLFVQTGGVHNVQWNLRIDAGTNNYGEGRYELHGGELSTWSTTLNDFSELAEFLQTGGTHTISTDLWIGEWYYLDGGVLGASTFNIYSNGLMRQTDGQATAEKIVMNNEYSDGNRTYEISGGTLYVDELSVRTPRREFRGRFIQSGGIVTAATRVSIGSTGDDAYTISGGQLNAGYLEVGGTLAITSPAAEVYVSSELNIGRNATFSAVPGATIHMTGSAFENESTDPAALAGLTNLRLIFEGGPADIDPFEVAGEDLGDDPAGLLDNFAIDTLQIGGSDIGLLQLVDLFDNQADGQAVGEALYVKHLIVGAGCSLDLNGLNLYYLDASLDPAGEIIGGAPTKIIPEPATLSLLALGGLAMIRRRRRRLETTVCQAVADS